MKLVGIISLFFLCSCADTYTLHVVPEVSQKMFFVFNSDTTYPTEAFTKSIDPRSDTFTVGKIKYVPIKKYTTNRTTEDTNPWGQSAIHIKLEKTVGIFSSSTIFEQSIVHFFNPSIATISDVEKSKIQRLNPDLNSGLGNSAVNNFETWGALGNTEIKSALLTEVNFKHSLILKYSASISKYNDFKDLNTLTRRISDQRTQLFTRDFNRCSITYPNLNETN